MHTLYEAEQQQRAFERKIRATKRTLAACDEALNNLSDEELLQKLEKNFSHYSSKLKRQESELNSFCKRTGLLPDGSRSQVYGFGRSTAQKAVWKNKKQKVDAAANSAIRNTGKVLEFNSKTSFRINIDGYDQAIIDGLSSASKRVAELGSNLNNIDGIVYLSVFPCGTDSLVNELAMRKIKDVPYINIVLDEQDADAGLQTRIESFVDILNMKERDEKVIG